MDVPRQQTSQYSTVHGIFVTILDDRVTAANSLATNSFLTVKANRYTYLAKSVSCVARALDVDRWQGHGRERAYFFSKHERIFRDRFTFRIPKL